MLMEKNGFADELFGECGHFGQIKGEDGGKRQRGGNRMEQ